MSNILHNRKIKDVLDRFAAFWVIILTSPIFLILAIILKLKRDDVFFIQERVGLGLKKFRMIKFTTMLRGSEKFGSITTANDPRITLFGRILRQTKLNEIPQLINILKGEMSFVGPRPLPMSEVTDYYSLEDGTKIYSVKPGITGVGSLEFSDEENMLDSMEDHERYFAQVVMPRKAELELGYVDNWNLILDFIIVAKTIFKLCKQTLAMALKIFGLLKPSKQPDKLNILDELEILTVDRSDK